MKFNLFMLSTRKVAARISMLPSFYLTCVMLVFSIPTAAGWELLSKAGICAMLLSCRSVSSDALTYLPRAILNIL